MMLNLICISVEVRNIDLETDDISQRIGRRQFCFARKVAERLLAYLTQVVAQHKTSAPSFSIRVIPIPPSLSYRPTTSAFVL